MDKEMKFPGYDIILANSIFGKEGQGLESLILPIKLPTTDVLLLSKYSVPTKKQVCNYIQNSIKNLELMVHNKNDSEKEWHDYLSNSIKEIPKKEVINLVKGDKDSMKHLESHCELGDHVPGKKYLYALMQDIPSPALDSLVSAYNTKGLFLLSNSLSSINKNRNAFQMQLNKDGSLMDENELKYLLDRGVRNSDVLKIECDREEYLDAVKNLELIYSVLNSSGNINNLKDDSKMFLIYEAVGTLSGFGSCVSGAESFERLSKTLKKKLGLEDDAADEDKKDNKLDFFNHHSEN
jgi:hypothetical protein